MKLLNFFLFHEIITLFNNNEGIIFGMSLVWMCIISWYSVRFAILLMVRKFRILIGWFKYCYDHIFNYYYYHYRH